MLDGQEVCVAEPRPIAAVVAGVAEPAAVAVEFVVEVLGSAVAAGVVAAVAEIVEPAVVGFEVEGFVAPSAAENWPC